MEDLVESFKCVICFEFADVPQECPDCGKLYCNSCIINSKQTTCPSCRTSNVSSFKLSVFAKRQIGCFEIECKNCNLKFKRNNIDDHNKKCLKRIIKCSLCKFSGFRDDFKNHFFNEHFDTIIEKYEESEEIEMVSFDSSGNYIVNGITAGTNRIEDLNDRSLTKGICAKINGWIIIELKKQYEVNEIEIGGWNGNKAIWGVSNGSGASISTSLDKSNWSSVGAIPTNYGAQIQKVSLKCTPTRYIKFEQNSYIGIGFLKIYKN